ncbi:MAG TPA: hypothetical protein VHL60_10005 [Oxalicibacterium sp.]|jgi:uncharacterized membrane protein|nr:hypothetical protein [Oxalicibacterium sp.]
MKTMDLEEKNYLWQHFVFNAEQRLKAFNFFVVFSVFANGGVFAAAEKQTHGAVFVLVGGFVIVLACVFWIIDARSQSLQLAVPGLAEYEKRFSEQSRLFTNDSMKRRKFIRYTAAFRALFCLQAFFGLGAVVYGFRTWI